MRKNIYQGYEVQKHRVIMTGRMVFQVSSACFMLQLLFFFAAIKVPSFSFSWATTRTDSIPFSWRLTMAERMPSLYRELLWKWPVTRLARHLFLREDAYTIINSCGSKLVLNLGDPDAARFFSELASEEEYCRRSNMDIDKFDQAQTDAGSHRD